MLCVQFGFFFFLTNSTGSAFEQLMPAALRTGGMAEDALVLQQKLSTRTLRRGLASDKSGAVEKEQEGGEASHGRDRGN